MIRDELSKNALLHQNQINKDKKKESAGDSSNFDINDDNANIPEKQKNQLMDLQSVSYESLKTIALVREKNSSFLKKKKKKKKKTSFYFIFIFKNQNQILILFLFLCNRFSLKIVKFQMIMSFNFKFLKNPLLGTKKRRKNYFLFNIFFV